MSLPFSSNPMAFDQPNHRPFSSIFGDSSNSNPPTDTGGQSFSYPQEGTSDSDTAGKKNDFSAFTDRQPQQAAKVKTPGINGKADRGENGEKGANSKDGTMLDEPTPKTRTTPVETSRGSTRLTTGRGVSAPAKKAAKTTKKVTMKKATKNAAVKKVGKKPVKKAAPKKAAKKKAAAAKKGKPVAKKKAAARAVKKSRRSVSAKKTTKTKTKAKPVKKAKATKRNIKKAKPTKKAAKKKGRK